MSLDMWIAFAIASSILTLIPGPSVLLVVSQALTRGMPAALMCILGNVLAGVVLMALSLLGVGAILAASATLFTLFKWLGVIYMAYLGCCQIIAARKTTAKSENTAEQQQNLGSFKAGFLAALLNPKAVIFYMAFLPQFMSAENDPLAQFLILICTSSLVIALFLTGYALIAAKARQFFQSDKSKKYFNYSAGSFLIGSSALMASTSK